MFVLAVQRQTLFDMAVSRELMSTEKSLVFFIHIDHTWQLVTEDLWEILLTNLSF